MLGIQIKVLLPLTFFLLRDQKKEPKKNLRCCKIAGIHCTIAIKFPTQNLLRKFLGQGNFIDAIDYEFFRQFFKGGHNR